MTSKQAREVIRVWRKEFPSTDLEALVHTSVAWSAHLAGSTTSKKKARSSRINGRKGGRPKGT